MYAKSLQIDNFKCFGQVAMPFQYPARSDENAPILDNVNLILGDNGGGKTSILRAIAIAVSGHALSGSGFVAWRLVRRAKPGQSAVADARLCAEITADAWQYGWATLSDQPYFEFSVRLEAEINQPGNEIDKLTEINPNLPPGSRMLIELSTSFPFIVGYGATRRLEIGDYSESSARRSRGPRNRRSW